MEAPVISLTRMEKRDVCAQATQVRNEHSDQILNVEFVWTAGLWECGLLDFVLQHFYFDYYQSGNRKLIE